MSKLDRSKPFGKITPALQDDDMDRPAFSEQDGKLFDAHDREIVRGTPLPNDERRTDAPDQPAQTQAPGEKVFSAAELIAGVDVMPWQVFRKGAKAILGDTCPSGKPAILEALKKAQAGYEARLAKRAGHAGIAWDPQGEGEGHDGEDAAPAQTKAGGVDLAAWGRGQTNYLFAEVRKAIKARFNKMATTEQNAIEILLDEGVITADRAKRVAA